VRTNPAYAEDLAYEPGDPKTVDVSELEETADIRKAMNE